MQNKKISLAAVFGITALLFAACSSSGSSVSTGECRAGKRRPRERCGLGTPPRRPPASAAVDAKTAKSAADMGGVDAVCAAGKAEGQVNMIATPPDWANYGQMINDFTAKYGIKVQSDKPDGNSQDEINAATQLAGTGRQPDIFDIGSCRRRWRTPTCTPRTRWPPGRTSPTRTRRPTGLWVNNYTGFESIGYDAKLGDIAKVADLADPKYKGKVALNGDPLKASAGFNGVVLAALANGGSADNIAPGVDFFKKLADSRQPPAGRPEPGHDRVRPDPDRHRLDVQQRRPRQRRSRRRASTGRSSSRRTRRPSPRSTTTRSTRTPPHPAAARCWMEYIYSDAGQNAWLKGFALPVRSRRCRRPERSTQPRCRDQAAVDARRSS